MQFTPDPRFGGPATFPSAGPAFGGAPLPAEGGPYQASSGGVSRLKVGLAVGGIAVLIVGWFLFVSAGQHSANHLGNGLALTRLRLDLVQAGRDEEAYLISNGQYTNQLTAMENAGNIQLTVGPRSDLGIGVDGSTGFCIVGAVDGKGSWYLYDSGTAALSLTSFPSAAAAEAACSDHAAAPYNFGA